MAAQGMILLEHGPSGAPVLFAAPKALFVAHSRDAVIPMLDAAENARRKGAWIAGFLGYEAGYAFEPRLMALPEKPRRGQEPYLALAAFDAPAPADAILAEAAQAAQGAGGAGGAALDPLVPAVTRAEYDAAIARVLALIGAGDCYQINLTFPILTRLTQGTPLGLYGALRARQRVGFGAYIDLPDGPIVISRSPELFFRLSPDGLIQSRPMKGTAPRGADPVEDAALRAELRASQKAQAENLMIVDLLRNDIARLSQVGSVRVPELYSVETFATLHQMSSLIEGRLRAGMGLADVMAALFPCGSITGAPKIRAMEIIDAVEPHPRGAYCGAIGFAAPDGTQVWNVAIRTLRLWPDGGVTLNVGGGVVQDSTAQGEWEEAFWKARYAEALAR